MTLPRPAHFQMGRSVELYSPCKGIAVKSSILLFLALSLGAIAPTPAAAQGKVPSSAIVQIGLTQDGQSAVTVEKPRASSVLEVYDWDFDPVAAKRGLCATDLDLRLAYADALLGKLRTSGAPRKEVRTWLTEASAGRDELAWTSRLLLRDLDQMTLELPDSLTDLSDSRLLVEKLVGKDGLSGPDGLRALHLESEKPNPMPDLEEALEGWIGSAGTSETTFPMAQTPGRELMTLEVRVTPSGARIRIMEAPHFAGTKPGANNGEDEQVWETELREYAGDSLLSIMTEHPDLISRLPFQVQGVMAPKQLALRTDILGVYTQKLKPAVSLQFALTEGQGLEVVRIEPGTIAQALGVSPGSVLLEVCGTLIDGDSDIGVALGGRVDSEICVVWLDSTGRQHERTWRDGATSTFVESFTVDDAKVDDAKNEDQPPSARPLKLAPLPIKGEE